MTDEAQTSAITEVRKDLEVTRARLDERWSAYRIEQDLHNKALDIAEQSINRRLDSMNELREQLGVAEMKFATKTETEAAIKSLAMLVHTLERTIWMASGAVVVIVALINWMRK